jgi:hypothetical protein
VPSEVSSCYKIFLFSWSRLGEVFFIFYTEALRDWDNSDDASFDNLRVMERKSTNNFGGATNKNRHERDVEYE